MSSRHKMPSLVSFDHAREYVISIGKPNHILLEYVVDPQHRVTCKDWVGIFPNDSSFQDTVDFNRIVDYEYVLHRPVNAKELRYKMKINLKAAKNFNFDQEYVFVYFSIGYELLGVSDTIRFIDLAARKVSPRKAQQESCGSTQRVLSIPERIQDGKSTPMAENEENVDINQQGQICKVKNNKLSKDHSNKVYGGMIPFSANNSHLSTNCKTNLNCSNCQRVGALLNIQSELYLQVKNLAEINSELTGKISTLQKQIELNQAAYQKQSVLAMREREARLFFQKCVEESGLNFQKYLMVHQPVLVGFDYYQSPVIAYQTMEFASRSLQQIGSNSRMMLTPGDPGPTERARPEERMRINQIIKLKAVIGNQEGKLRALSEALGLEQEKVCRLTKQLKEMQCGKVQKVKAVMKDVENLSCGDNAFNNNVGEEVED